MIMNGIGGSNGIVIGKACLYAKQGLNILKIKNYASVMLKGNGIDVY